MKTYLILERDYTVPGNIVRREEVTIKTTEEEKALFAREKAVLAQFEKTVVNNPRGGLTDVSFYGRNSKGHPASVNLGLFPEASPAPHIGD